MSWRDVLGVVSAPAYPTHIPHNTQKGDGRANSAYSADIAYGTPTENRPSASAPNNSENHALIEETCATLDAVAHASYPMILADGRRLYRMSATIIGGDTGLAAEAMANARRFGAVLVADGETLVLVEPHRLPDHLLSLLRRHAGAAISVLRGEHRQRVDAPAAENAHPHPAS